MKVVGLISGGKDSCFNLLKCVKYGHEIICLANLAPANRSIQELDSYMFQTVGHNMIPAIAQCMELPLVVHDLKGTAIQKNLHYSHEGKENEADEVEDLYVLLKKVKQSFPDVEAVACGAILSDYQRLRVENVCSRLQLVSLTYLWRRDQSDLLNEMVHCDGFDAILIKTATMGLHPKKHLNISLKLLQTFLEKLKAEVGINVCGEGGEYETLTLDLPIFKKRIVIDESEVIVESNDMYAPVGHLIIKKYHLQEK